MLLNARILLNERISLNVTMILNPIFINVFECKITMNVSMSPTFKDVT